jgi:DNA-binding NarL/FixJ family response regulator
VTKPVRVLLADDNPAMLEVVKHLLQKEFDIVGTLEQASAVLRETPEINPDVLIVDVSLGELNGFEIARQLRNEKCPSKIIFLTVHEELEFIRAAYDAGASAYVFKSRMSTDLGVAINAVQAGRVFLPGPPIGQ